MRYAKILCPVDFSEPSREALVAAADLARTFDASLTLVHVYQLPLAAVPEMSVDPELYGMMGKRADEELARLTQEALGLGVRRVESTRLEGVAWDVIVKLARDGRVDLVVMGTHGRTGLRHALLGSVAERVVRHASCPVLVVRAPAAAAS
jgi:universal stress protein A